MQPTPPRRQTRPVHRPPAQAQQHYPCDTDQGASKSIASAASDEAAPRSRCQPTRAPAPPRSPPQAAGPPQEHERAQLSEASVEVLRCMRTGPLPPAVGAPGANLSGAEEALIFFGPALACAPPGPAPRTAEKPPPRCPSSFSAMPGAFGAKGSGLEPMPMTPCRGRGKGEGVGRKAGTRQTASRWLHAAGGCGGLRGAAGGCGGLRRAAGGCRWLQVAAGGCGGCRGLQGAAAAARLAHAREGLGEGARRAARHRGLGRRGALGRRGRRTPLEGVGLRQRGYRACPPLAAALGACPPPPQRRRALPLEGRLLAVVRVRGRARARGSVRVRARANLALLALEARAPAGVLPLEALAQLLHGR